MSTAKNKPPDPHQSAAFLRTISVLSIVVSGLSVIAIIVNEGEPEALIWCLIGVANGILLWIVAAVIDTLHETSVYSGRCVESLTRFERDTDARLRSIAADVDSLCTVASECSHELRQINRETHHV